MNLGCRNWNDGTHETVDPGGIARLGVEAGYPRKVIFALPRDSPREPLGILELGVFVTVVRAYDVPRPPTRAQLFRLRHMSKVATLSLALPSLIICLALAQTPPVPAADGSAGVEGTISVTPIQGGPTRKGEPDSKPLANIMFEVKQNGQVTKSFQTDDRGQFHVELKPGHYTIARKDRNGVVGFYGPFEVEVAQGKVTKVEWKCDSGIR